MALWLSLTDMHFFQTETEGHQNEWYDYYFTVLLAYSFTQDLGTVVILRQKAPNPRGIGFLSPAENKSAACARSFVLGFNLAGVDDSSFRSVGVSSMVTRICRVEFEYLRSVNGASSPFGNSEAFAVVAVVTFCGLLSR